MALRPGSGEVPGAPFIHTATSRLNREETSALWRVHTGWATTHWPTPGLHGRIDIMIRTLLLTGLLATGVAACTTAQPYGPASSATAQGFQVQPIESNRYRVSYTALSPENARRYALRRAAEVTLENGGEWFRVVSGYTDATGSRSGGSSVSLGGSSSSGGYSGVGVGVGIGLPLGGGNEKTTESLEIVTGTGPKPDTPDAYDAESVLINTAGPA